MQKQLKFILWNLLFVSILGVTLLVFTVLVNAKKREISDKNIPASNKQINEKPVFRCPKNSFMLRTGCHQSKSTKTAKASNTKLQ